MRRSIGPRLALALMIGGLLALLAVMSMLG